MSFKNSGLKIFFHLFIALGIVVPCFADSTDHVAGAWFGTFIKKPVVNNYYLWAETQLRHDLEAGSVQQVLYRGGVLRKVTEEHEVGLLYLFAQSDNIKEHRLTLQHASKYGEFLSGNFSARTRFEARKLEDNSNEAFRLRYLLRYDTKTFDNYNPIVWNEVFLNLNREEWTGDRFYERNRFFLGSNIEFESLRFEIGYLNQHVPRTKLTKMEHLITVYLFF